MAQAEAKEFAARAMKIQSRNATEQDILDVRNVSLVWTSDVILWD
jgi:hypothetical protein